MTRLVVVGGGPVGLVTALWARRAGCAVTVVERGAPGRDKACGEGIMPAGVALLEEIGVRTAGDEGLRFRGVRYVDGEVVAEADFPHGRGLGVRRTVLHRALADAAERAGAELRWNTTARGLHHGDARAQGVITDAGVVRADWIVGADGLHSAVRGWAGLSARAGRHARYGVRRHFRLPPWSDRVEVHWAEGAEAYVTPVGPACVGVALLWSGGGGDFDALLARFPAVAERLAGVVAASAAQGAGPFHQRVPRVHRGRVALVGDAAGYLDAITGEGLTLGFLQARAAVEAIATGDLRRYARAHRRLGRTPWALMRALLWLERHPRARRRAMRLLARHPRTFSRLLGLAAGPPVAPARERTPVRVS